MVESMVSVVLFTGKHEEVKDLPLIHRYNAAIGLGTIENETGEDFDFYASDEDEAKLQVVKHLRKRMNNMTDEELADYLCIGVDKQLSAFEEERMRKRQEEIHREFFSRWRRYTRSWF